MCIMKKHVSLFLFAIFLVACSSPAVTTSIPPTLTATLLLPTETPIPIATSTPFPTPDPNAPQGYTRVENGVYYMDTSENGIDYHYTWDSNEKLWLRPVGTFPLIDLETTYIPLRVLISSSAQGGQDFVSLSHTNSTSDSDLPPLTAEVEPAFRQRVSEPNMTQFQLDMLGRNGGSVYLSLITSTGEKAQVKLTQTTTFITEIVGYSDLQSLIGKGVSKWKDIHGATFLTIVTGVDAEGIHGKIAFQGDIRTLTDEQKRNMIFEIVGSILDNEDQRVMSQSQWAYVFADDLVKACPDGTQDVGIVYNP